MPGRASLLPVLREVTIGTGQFYFPVLFFIHMNKFRKPHGSGGPRGGERFGERGPARPSFDRPRFGGPSRPRFGGPRKEGVELFDAVCSKCGKACQVPFRPNGKKPVYCRACFGIPANDSSRREDFVRRDAPAAVFEPREPRNENHEMADLKQQIGAMNSKIDSLLRMLGSLPRAAAPAAVVEPVASVAAQPKEVVQEARPKKKVAKKKSSAK